MERGRGRKEEREGWGRPLALLPPTGFCLKYHPGSRLVVDRAPCCRTENSIRTRRQLYQSLFSPLHVGYTRRIIADDDANTNLYDVRIDHLGDRVVNYVCQWSYQTVAHSAVDNVYSNHTVFQCSRIRILCFFFRFKKKHDFYVFLK